MLRFNNSQTSRINLSRALRSLAILPMIALLLYSCAGSKTTTSAPKPLPSDGANSPSASIPHPPADRPTSVEEVLPPFAAPKRELRGIWVATVANIDWPSSGNISFAQQQKEFIEILDFYAQRNFNAVFVQVRAAGDAFYPSKYAPWSSFLTGQQGKAPSTSIDPLHWMIKACHERGMEFHAWLNPYRATFNLDTKILSPKHDYFLHPDWMVTYAAKRYYNPGLPAVREHINKVIKELAENYDLDGIHFDDYFYPYKVNGKEFDDKAAFQRYGKGLSLADWRRQSVDLLIQEVSQSIKTTKPWISFGVSPFGVWRNQTQDKRGSATSAGQTNYDDLYADPLVWMKNGWVDYIAPQIYWSVNHPAAPYETLAKWWAQNSYGLPVYIGHSAYKVRADTDQSWQSSFELANQVALSRQIPHIEGNIFFRARSLMNANKDVADLLLQNVYTVPALPPAINDNSPVFKELKPEVTETKITATGISLRLDNAYLAQELVLFGYNASGKWELLEQLPVEEAEAGEWYHFAHSMAPNYGFLALGFLGNYGEMSQLYRWKQR